MGTFLQTDLVAPRPEEMNAYVYAMNNPINLTDPEGLYAPPSTGDKRNCERVKREHPELWKGKNDKYAHCALGCQITEEYGPWVASNCAWAKEIRDKYDNDPNSQCDPKDFEASLDGVKVGTGGGDCSAGCQGLGYKP